MFNVPLTYLFDFDCVSDKMRPYIMQEFAACGAKHLVLNKFFIKKILSDPLFADVLTEEMNSCGLSFCDSHAPYGQLDDLYCSGRKRRMMIARQKLVLEVCAYMKIDTVTMHAGSSPLPYADGTPLEVHVERVRETLAELLPCAEKLNLTICIENSWYPTASPELICRIKEDFPTPALGLCYDSGHANILDNGRNFPQGKAWDAWQNSPDKTPQWEDKALEKMLPHVVVCHLHDNNGQIDQHTIPGAGSVKWQHIIPLLNNAPRIKAMQCEIHTFDNNIRIADITASFKRLEQFI